MGLCKQIHDFVIKLKLRYIIVRKKRKEKDLEVMFAQVFAIHIFFTVWQLPGIHWKNNGMEPLCLFQDLFLIRPWPFPRQLYQRLKYPDYTFILPITCMERIGFSPFTRL